MDVFGSLQPAGPVLHPEASDACLPAAEHFLKAAVQQVKDEKGALPKGRNVRLGKRT